MWTAGERLSMAQIILAVWGFCIFSVVFFSAWDLYRKRHIIKFSRKHQGPQFFPILGNVYHIFGQNFFIGLQELSNKFKLPFNLWIGHDYNYVTADAREIKILLNNPNSIEKNSFYNNFRLGFEHTLLVTKHDEWKRNRKIFAKSFSQPILNSFVDIFYRKACTLVEVLKDSDLRDTYDIFERLSLDNFCSTIIGVDLNAQMNIDDGITESARIIQEVVGKRMLSVHIIPDCIFLQTRDGKIGLKELENLKCCIYDIIQKKRIQFLENRDLKQNTDKLPLMDMMLEGEGKLFSDDEIFREIILFLLAATDTSGITLAYFFTVLGMHPDIQEKVYQEIKQNIGIDRPIYYDDLPNLKYTEAALFESMRLIPVIPLLGRLVTADIDLGTKIIPAGSNVIISIFNVHRSEEYWPNPLVFNPDRFSSEEVSKRNPYYFIPFSGGPRNCIGMKYALMMMKATAAHVIRNFKIESKHESIGELKFASCVTMKTTHELSCIFTPRNM